MEPLKCSNCKMANHGLCVLSFQPGTYECIQRRVPKRVTKTFTRIRINRIAYANDLDIRNLDALPRGTGAKYLLTIRGEGTALIAKEWRRVEPKALLLNEVLVTFE